MASKNIERPTREKINRMFEICEDRVLKKMCMKWKCSECRLSDRYQAMAGIRLEDLPMEVR